MLDLSVTIRGKHLVRSSALHAGRITINNEVIKDCTCHDHCQAKIEALPLVATAGIAAAPEQEETR